MTTDDVSKALMQMRGHEMPMQGMISGGQNPFQLNQGLEKTAGQTQDLTGILQSLLNHFGMLALIRNQRNQGMSDVSQALGQ